MNWHFAALTGNSVHMVTSASKHVGRKRFSKKERRKANVIVVVMTSTKLSLQEECVPPVQQSGAFDKKMS